MGRCWPGVQCRPRSSGLVRRRSHRNPMCRIHSCPSSSRCRRRERSSNAVKPCDATMVRGSNGTQVNAAKAQVECARGRTGGVPVDEPDQRAITPNRVPRRDVVVAHHQTGPPGLPGEPGHVRRHLSNWATESVNADVVIGQHGSGWRTRRSGTRRGVHRRRRFRPLRGLPGLHRPI